MNTGKVDEWYCPQCGTYHIETASPEKPREKVFCIGCAGVFKVSVEEEAIVMLYPYMPEHEKLAKDQFN